MEQFLDSVRKEKSPSEFQIDLATNMYKSSSQTGVRIQMFKDASELNLTDDRSFMQACEEFGNLSPNITLDLADTGHDSFVNVFTDSESTIEKLEGSDVRGLALLFCSTSYLTESAPAHRLLGGYPVEMEILLSALMHLKRSVKIRPLANDLKAKKVIGEDLRATLFLAGQELSGKVADKQKWKPVLDSILTLVESAQKRIYVPLILERVEEVCRDHSIDSRKVKKRAQAACHSLFAEEKVACKEALHRLITDEIDNLFAENYRSVKERTVMMTPPRKSGQV